MSDTASRDSLSAEPDGSANGLNLNALRPPKYVLDTKVMAPCHHVPGRKDGKPCNRCRQNAWEKERRELARSERRRSAGGSVGLGGGGGGGGKRGHSIDSSCNDQLLHHHHHHPGAHASSANGGAADDRVKTEDHREGSVELRPNWPAKRARRVPSEERSKELDRAATRVEIRKQDLSPAVKKELLRWENHQMNRKLTTRRLELLQTFSFFFCFGISWEDILESAEGHATRPDGWEDENAKLLQQIDDERFFVFVQSQETGAWMQVVAKAEGLLGKDLELFACGASQELALQLCDPEREDMMDEDDAAPAGCSIKAGCVGGSFQVGVVLPPGSARLGHQLLRPPRRYPDMDLGVASDRMLDCPGTELVLQELSDVYQMFLPTSWARAQEWNAVCGKYVPDSLFLPHLTAAWNTNVKCHRDAPNRVQSMIYVHGPFEGGDYAFPALNFRTRAPSGTAFWGWTDILEYYVCDWSDRRRGLKGYRATWMLTLSADIYDEVMSHSGSGCFFDKDKLFGKNDLFDWQAVYDLTGGSRQDLEKVMFK
ncbi:hypothetical protein DFJ77DRAFT_453029 [Powellomyces hirtus]|nr:hypothetical protein DFJ77DRAFT_453029 [Powellomyces hirtus]